MQSHPHQQHMSHINDCASHGHDSVVISLEATSEIPQQAGSAHQHSQHADHAPVMLEFRDVSYWLPPKAPSLRERLFNFRQHQPDGGVDADSVSVSSVKKRYGKQLLVSVSGAAHAGRLLAVMGPSGAGKTTLLGILAGDRDVLSPSAGRLSGKVLLVGQERHLPAFRRICAHVKQDDMLLPTTTPREALAFAAALRLPGRSAAAKHARLTAVQEMLEGMCLQHCADTLVGESRDGVKGLSGGERRRLAVASELLGKPRLALLDEPSSGQDSSTAVQMLSFIKQLITTGDGLDPSCTGSHRSSTTMAPGALVITLHQPGRELTELLDDLLLLAPGGRAVYAGPWAGALPYFEQHLQLTPPLHTSLAEWYLSLLTSRGLGSRTSSSISCSSSSSDNVSSLSTLNLHQSWVSYMSEQGPLHQQRAFSLCSCEQGCSEQHALPKQHEQPEVLPVVRVIARQDTVLSALSDTSAVEIAAEAGDIQMLPVPRHRPFADHSSEGHLACQEHCSRQEPWDHVQLETISQGSQLCAQAASLARNGGRHASFLVQVRVLAVRSLHYWWRNPAMVLAEALQYLFVVLFLGSCYPRLPTEGQAAALDRLAVLFMWVTSVLVTAPARALLGWDMERQLLRRELATGAYSLTPFLVSKLAIGLPLETVLVASTGSILYLLVGLQATAAKYGAWLALSVLCALSAHNFGNLLGLCLPNLHAALPALCIGATLILAFAGFIVQAVPVWWVWMGDASFCTYAYAGLVRNEFEGLQLTLPASATTLTAGGAAGNTLSAATQNALKAALAGLQGSVAASLRADIDTKQHSSVIVQGIDVVPSTIRVHFGTVQQFTAMLLGFTVGSSILVIALTAVLVRWRYQ